MNDLLLSIQKIQKILNDARLISTRLRDHEDASSVIQRQGSALDDQYIINWLSQFEQALDDSTLVNEYKRLSGQFKK